MSDFISVNKLVEKVQHDKNGKASRISRLQAILESRKEKRETWDPEKKDNYEKFLVRLKLAHDNYVKALKTKIVECAEKILQNNINAKFFKLWDPQNLDCELEGFSEFTIYRGFWNSEKKKHDRLPHMEAGISATPLRQVTKELMPLGYNVDDISDLTKSTHVVIQVNLNSRHTLGKKAASEERAAAAAEKVVKEVAKKVAEEVAEEGAAAAEEVDAEE